MAHNQSILLLLFLCRSPSKIATLLYRVDVIGAIFYKMFSSAMFKLHGMLSRLYLTKLHTNLYLLLKCIYHLYSILSQLVKHTIYKPALILVQI